MHVHVRMYVCAYVITATSTVDLMAVGLLSFCVRQNPTPSAGVQGAGPSSKHEASRVRLWTAQHQN